MKKIWLVVVLLFLIKTVSAVSVGVVVDYPNSTVFTQCLSVDRDTNGYDILQKSELAVAWSSAGIYGHALCKIDGVGDEVAGTNCQWGSDYWGFFLVDNNTWGYSPVGLDAPGDCWNRDFSSFGGHYCAQHEDVLGFAYGPFGKEPTLYDFGRICGNKLNIKGIKVYVDGDKQSGIDENGGDIDGVKPESKVKLNIELENTYTDDEDLEIQSIGLTVTINDIDDGDDLEEESDEFDLDADDSETIDIEFDIPLEVEDGNYDLELTIEGEDEKGIEYNSTIIFDLKVEKEKHELKFTKAGIDNDNLDCNRATEIDVGIVNLGEKEEEVMLEIKSAELAIEQKEEFTLDNDPFDDESKYSNSFPLTIDSAIAAGSYPIIIKADYNDGKSNEKEAVYLTINDCKVTSASEAQQTTQSIGLETEKQLAATAADVVSQQITTKKIDKTRLIAIAVIAFEAIIIIGGLVWVIGLFRK